MFPNNSKKCFNFNNIDIHPTYCLRVYKVISKNVNYYLLIPKCVSSLKDKKKLKFGGRSVIILFHVQKN